MLRVMYKAFWDYRQMSRSENKVLEETPSLAFGLGIAHGWTPLDTMFGVRLYHRDKETHNHSVALGRGNLLLCSLTDGRNNKITEPTIPAATEATRMPSFAAVS